MPSAIVLDSSVLSPLTTGPAKSSIETIAKTLNGVKSGMEKTERGHHD